MNRDPARTDVRIARKKKTEKKNDMIYEAVSIMAVLYVSAHSAKLFVSYELRSIYILYINLYHIVCVCVYIGRH